MDHFIKHKMPEIAFNINSDEECFMYGSDNKKITHIYQPINGKVRDVLIFKENIVFS